MIDKIKIKIKFEIDQIDKLLKDSYLLFKKNKSKKPDFIEISAIAAVLHSFYNGIENIFIIISKNIDGKIPKDKNWHKSLIENLSKSNIKRNIIINENIKKILIEYMEFRHFFRHSYTFHLDWDKMKNLVNNINDFWNNLKIQINNFLIKIK